MPNVTGNCTQARRRCPLQREVAPAVAGDTPERREWAQAFAKQAQSDHVVYEILSAAVETRAVAECHRWHYLQMSCEKIAKAYQIRDTPSNLEKAMSSHTAFRGVVTNLLGCPEIKRRYENRVGRLRDARHIANAVSREIERLAPAVDRAITPANTEYPWADGTKVIVPSEYHFSALDELQSFGGIEFLKILKIVVEEFASITIA